MSIEYELEKAPSISEFLSVIVNREDVEAIISKPVRACIFLSNNAFTKNFFMHREHGLLFYVSCKNASE